jgi:hypothetical protein
VTTTVVSYLPRMDLLARISFQHDVYCSTGSATPSWVIFFFLLWREAFHVLELGLKLLGNVFTFSLIKWLLCSQMREDDVWICLFSVRDLWKYCYGLFARNYEVELYPCMSGAGTSSRGFGKMLGICFSCFSKFWVGANQLVLRFLGGKALGIQQGTNVWIGSSKS